MTCILELNDSAITLYRDTSVVQRAPGIAVVLEDGVHFGDQALRLSRIHPRQCNQQYFSRLNADPLPVPGRHARNHADLVYLHLSTLKTDIDRYGDGTVLLAVPGILSPDQLGVVLGVLQEIGVRVLGFVDAAVAAASTRPLPAQAYHIDIMLQRAVVTTLSGDHEVGKSSATEVPECGLNRLIDGWINVIADRFVRETRFDPLHAAATEQQLFNQVYDWVDGGAATTELAVEIRHGDHNPRVELGRSALEEKAEQRLRQVADAIPRGAQVLLSARAARLPGMQRTLQTLRIDAEPLSDDALPAGCLEHLDAIVGDGSELVLVTRLPGASGAPSARPEPSGIAPSHALRGHEAWPLGSGDGPLPVRRDGQRLRLSADPGVLLNGRPLREDATLQCGDRVAIGEQEYLIIAVRNQSNMRSSHQPSRTPR